MSIRWAFNLSTWNPTFKELLQATSCLQPEEKERIGRFVFRKDFKASLVGRLMLRKFVSVATPVPYAAVRFCRDPKGKPVLTNELPHNLRVSFNVSHQGGYAVLAGEVGPGPLGVDVMKLEYAGGKSLPEFFRIMTKHFSGTEWECIRGAGGESGQIGMFCRHWCLKESYVKAIGVGITVNLQDISFRVKSKALSVDRVTADTELRVRGEEVKGWRFEETLVDGEHCVAVARNDESGDAGKVFEKVDLDFLLKDSVALIAEDENYCEKFFSKS